MSTEVNDGNEETPKTGVNEEALQQDVLDERMDKVLNKKVRQLITICQKHGISYKGKKLEIARRLVEREDFDLIFGENDEDDSEDDEPKEEDKTFTSTPKPNQEDKTFTSTPKPKQDITFTQEQLNAIMVAFAKANVTENPTPHPSKKQNRLTFTSQVPMYQHSEFGISDYLKRLSLALEADDVEEDKKSHLLLLKMPEDIQRKLNNEFLGKPQLQSFQTLVATLERSHGRDNKVGAIRIKLLSFALDFSKDKFEESVKQLLTMVEIANPGIPPRVVKRLQKAELEMRTRGKMALWKLINESSDDEHIEVLVQRMVNANELHHQKFSSGKSKQSKAPPTTDQLKAKGGCVLHPKGNHTNEQCKFQERLKGASKDNQVNKVKASVLPEVSQKSLDIRIPININAGEGMKSVFTVGYVDSGAQVSIMENRLARQLEMELAPPRYPGLKTLGGNQLTPVASVKVDMKIGQRMISLVFEVVDAQLDVFSKVLIGSDVLSLLSANIQYGNLPALVVDGVTIPSLTVDDLNNRNKPVLSKVAEAAVEVENFIKSKFPNVISQHQFDLGKSIIPAQKIELMSGDIAPFRRYFPPQHYRKDALEYINQMVESGVCKPSFDAKFMFNLVCAYKPSGSIRLCLDLRPLNVLVKSFQYRSWSVKDFCREFQNFSYVSSIDLVQSYYQVPLCEEDLNLIGFRWGDNCYTMMRLPFGLKTWPQISQKIMDQMLLNTKARSYQDDIILPTSGSRDEHLAALADLLKVLETYGFKINLSKSKFMAQECTFLGYKFTPAGYTITDKYTKSISDFPMPNTLANLRKFRGVYGYVRTMIPKCYEIERPLNQCIAQLESKKIPKNTIIELPNDVQKAIRELKEKVIEITIMAFPKWDEVFYLEADASIYGYGAVLYQINESDNTKNVIGYYNKSTSPLKRKYPTTHLELRSISNALTYFREFLWGNMVIVRSDHKNLKSLIQSNLDPRLYKHINNINMYNIQVEWIQGSKNTIADALSRVPEVKFVSSQTLADIQQESPSDVRKKYLKRGGIYGKIDGEKFKPFIPDPKVYLLVEEVHKATHMPKERTLQFIKRFYEANEELIKKSVDEVYSSCLTCMKSIPTGCIKKKSTMKAVSPFPRSTYTLDIMGPLPQSMDDQGYRFLLMAVDTASRFYMLQPLRDIKSQDVLEGTLKCIYQYGKPWTIKLDNAKYFQAELFKNKLNDLGITLRYGTPYYHESQTLVENALQLV
uniref:Reverse transcriptase n=1 Tax=Strongyloides papillosus TaxID=174720 RepID=A0A0N5B8W0_STREA